jgi:hypothetical protein
MTRLLFVLIISSGFYVRDAYSQTPAAIPSDAYHDTAAADHVRLARERRQIADLSVERYRALSKERISVGLRGIRRDRLLYRREVAGRIDWTRDGPGRIEILGAREAIPVAIKGVQLPSDIDSFMPHLAFDPADSRMLVDWGDNEFVRHPFAAGAEQFYRYRTGGTTSIQLPDGRVVRLVEIEIIPRTRDAKNITGSFWLEAGTHSIVQAAFRLAREIDIIKDLEEEDEDDDDVPRFLKPMIATLDYVTIEYGLYDLKWWMPRSMMFEGSVRAGMMRLPLEYERTYSNYEIEGGDVPANVPMAEILARDSIRRERQDSCEKKQRSITVNIGGKPKARADSTQTSVTQCGRWEIVMPADTAAMLTSTELPPDVFATGEQLVTEGELRELADKIEDLGGGPPLLRRPVLDLDVPSLFRTRYNRIEGLSLAGRADVDYGAYRAFAEARIGIADLHPNLELGVEKIGQKNVLAMGAYRRLNSFDPFVSPFSVGSSASALLFGRDDANYYRTLGVELKAEPTGSASSWYEARVFAQRETTAAKETDFSLRDLFNGSFEFPANMAADEGNAYGSEVRLRYNRGLDPEGFRFGTELFTDGAFGTHEYGRGAVTLRFGIPLPGALTGALEGAAGVTSVAAPLQHNWFIGGSNTVRGYRAATMFGETFWRGRAEIGLGLPAVRIVGFSDVGWAGPRDRFESGKPLLSVGGGVSVLDGILRFDVARGLREPKGWTATLYFDAAL